MTDETARAVAHNWQRVRVREKKTRALADAIAELRGHTCLGPELCFYYTLSRPLRKARGGARNGFHGPCHGTTHRFCPQESLSPVAHDRSSAPQARMGASVRSTCVRTASRRYPSVGEPRKFLAARAGYAFVKPKVQAVLLARWQCTLRGWRRHA
jgi:hypothetical protein